MLNAILFIGLPTAVILAFGVAFRVSAARDRRKLRTTRALQPDEAWPRFYSSGGGELDAWGCEIAEASRGERPPTIYRGREPLSEDHPYQRCLRDVGPKGLP